MRGSDCIIQFLLKNNSDIIFGYPGNAVMPLYDCIHKSAIKHILARHEQGCIHMAQGYARATGKTGVVIATSGPGATNLVTGITDAFIDSTPIVAITGQTEAKNIGTDAFQEADITGIVSPVTKATFLVKSADEIENALTQAFKIASSGRKGPVLIDITKNALVDEVKSQKIQNYDKTTTSCDISDMAKKAAKIINSSKRPCILLGGGTLEASLSGVLKEFLDKMNVPVATTLMGKGAVDENLPYSVQMAGIRGRSVSNEAIFECDTLIAFGTRFSERVFENPKEYAKGRNIIHVDIDDAELEKNMPVTLGVLADTEEFIKELLPLVKENAWEDFTKSIIKRKKDDVQKDYCTEAIIYEIAKYNKDSIIVTDVGMHQMYAARLLKVEKPRSFISSGGLGTMGFGLPCAIGVSLATNKRVILITGDGGFQMTVQEMATLKSLGLDLKIFLIDNKGFEMLRDVKRYDDKYDGGFDLLDNPDFSLVSKAFGVESKKVFDLDTLFKVTKEAMDTQSPYLVHCIVEK